MKRYGQYCPIAHALEVVGERWSLLIVRDLLKGPRRYTDLAEGLPGIGTNILAGRLRDLEAAGIVAKRKLAPPAGAVTVYELTEYGLDLEEAIQALARWGARTIGPPESDEELTPGWSVDALRALFNPFAAAGADGTYVLRIADDVTTLRVEDGSLVEVRSGAAEDADLVLEADFATFYELMVRTLAPEDALLAERVRIDGPPEELERLLSLLSLEPRYVAARPTPV